MRYTRSREVRVSKQCMYVRTFEKVVELFKIDRIFFPITLYPCSQKGSRRECTVQIFVYTIIIKLKHCPWSGLRRAHIYDTADYTSTYSYV